MTQCSAFATLATAATLGSVASTVRAQETLADSIVPRPISAVFSYTGNVVANVDGGIKRGSTFLGAAGAQVTVLLGPLAGWPDARLFLFVLGSQGGSASALVGDVQGVNNLEAPATTRLEEAWLQQNLLNNRLSLLVGRYDVNAEFDRLQSAALFLNSSFGVSPEFAKSGVQGPSIFPYTAVGMRVTAKPSFNLVWRAAVLDGVPVDRADGRVDLFSHGDGALLVSEMALLSRPDSSDQVPHNRRFRIGRGLTPNPYGAKVALGAWYYTGRFADLVDTLANGSPVLHRGSRGVYLIADGTLWSGIRGKAAPLTAFAQLGWGDERVNQVGGYVGGGITLAGPFSDDARDALGLAVAAAFNGSHYARTQTSPGPRPSSETTLELTYAVRPATWLTAQPDLQYVINPGADRPVRRALAPGLRVQLSP